MSGAVTELLPCPFCGCAMRVRSNRDWHRIVGDHDEACIFNEPETVMVPASADQLEAAVRDWNRRAAPVAMPVAWAPSTALDKLRNGANNAMCVLTDAPAEFNDTLLYVVRPSAPAPLPIDSEGGHCD